MSCVANRASMLAISVLYSSFASAVPAAAGDGNLVYIEQMSGSGGVGNTLYVDQSQASESKLAGDRAGTTPATQTGSGNTASVTLLGSQGSVVLSQENTGFGSALSELNTASITGGAFAAITLQQEGLNNSGTVNVGASDGFANSNFGALFQNGDNNTGSVNVSGMGNSGTLTQTGDANTYALEVTGTGTSVQWTQIGNNVAGAAPAQVFSNAGSVTVTQSSY